MAVALAAAASFPLIFHRYHPETNESEKFSKNLGVYPDGLPNARSGSVRDVRTNDAQ